MVRTRPRNKAKRVAVIDYGSDGEPPDAHDDLDDENFEAPPPDPEDDEDDPMDIDGGDDDFEADDPSSLAIGGPSNANDDDDDELPTYTSSAGLRKPPTDMAALGTYHADGRPTRHYTGALKRGQRIQVLDFFYGPQEEAVGVASWLLNRWAGYAVLPSKLPDGPAPPLPSPWLDPGFVEDQNHAAKVWFERLNDAKGASEGERKMNAEEAEGYRLKPGGHLVSVIGPYPDQQEVEIAPYDAIILSESGLPLTNHNAKEEKSVGWMFDAGGIVIGMEWASRTGQEAQILALAVIPHTDQLLDFEDAYDQSKGIIQLWELCGQKNEDGITRPLGRSARLARTVCSGWGRVTRLKWCPVSYRENGAMGLLAVLCSDGQVHVVVVKDIGDDEQDAFTKLEHPIVSLGIPSETNVTATCFAWVNTNRIVLGHSDGSLTLWSISPRFLLARHDVHSTRVMHIDTAYPSDPYLVASTPIAGYTTLVDFSDPSCERTSFPCFTITPQPNLLQWHDHLRGFFTVVPSANPLNASVGFVHSRWYAAQVRKVMDGDRLPTCLAAGIHHPFVLVGYMDGTVWAANPSNRIFASKHHFGHKMKIIDHQYIPRERLNDSVLGQDTAGESDRCRGASRILQGFRPVPNVNPKVDTWKTKVAINKKKDKKAKKPKAKARGKGKADAAAAEDDDADVQGGTEEGDGHFADPKRAVLSEPLTRITTMVWNPNQEYSCWAAVAMASGLVRVMDLGLEC
ncbi:transcription factor TFIIIC complex subunit [Colletotrichum tofieldiae]|uniref:Transcription factor TFIIIC complex subunit n=1 Tax=Colletotrichum tofieldiae TaxID=708197 RepID=A0A166PEZ4_9PEZI|nr:transcription factor TFIIIC complex subunit [Colletotrichum tofieldiae]GKT63263.1 transcription factor TFIIIC complex subunit [Colletotrichum tofieldiae]GKT72728.1 transcription factor TFIIIC complex subunit [Colletotrichum tofieldiae]GKT89431.1 transcription factor TFIIIC complex subunit [Colletotrichum tofieldiae]